MSWRRWRSMLAALLLIVATGVAVMAAGPAPARAATALTIDGASSGLTFDGVGAISGGGGNSRLLIDYPEPYRSQVLDYLFKPGYGASLQILKVEIGGDTNSTSGSELSYQHSSGSVDCQAGYEWWLMEQAKARNPNIKLYALAWGAPGWLGTFNSTATIGYLTGWLGCAKQNGLTIDYLGGQQNERAYSASFIEQLRTALDNAGYASTQIVGGDSVGWSIASDMASDSALDAAVSIAGAHYPCGYLNTMASCPSTATAESLGKPLWQSENGSQDYDSGAGAVARAINRGYIDGETTAYINWPIVGSIYDNIPWPTAGLIKANEPWSGQYDLGTTLWAIAHTAQVTAPGWKYVNSATGYFGGNRGNGSYVSYQAPDHSAYSVVAETLDASAPQTVTFNVTGGLPASQTVHVWASNFSSAKMTDYWVRQPDVTPSGGSFTATLQPGYVYSFTTLSTTGKGGAASPPSAPLTLPFSDGFDHDTAGQEPQYMAGQQGGFETVSCPGGRAGQCVRQMAPTTPIAWASATTPFTVVGSLAWTDYTVKTDAYLEQSGAVQVIGRANAEPSGNSSKMARYYLQAADTGAWSIMKDDTDGNLTTLASGTAAALGTDAWHTLAISFQGTTITASIDGAAVGSATDASYSAGEAGLGINGYQTDDFDNFSVTPIGAAATQDAYAILSKSSGMAMTPGSNGLIVQEPYSSGADQQWELTGGQSGYLTVTNLGTGEVLDVPSASTSAGVQLEQWPATGGTNQQWQVRANGDGTFQLYGRKAGQLADVANASTSAGAPVIQWPATGGANQAWTLVPVPVSGKTYALTDRNSGLAMDVNGASTSSGATVLQWPYKGVSCTWICPTSNQQWEVVSVGSGYVEIVNSHSGLALESPNAASGTQLDQAAYTGGTSQQWQFVYSAGGYYELVNRATGYAADISGGSTAQGAAVVVSSANGSTSQQWQLQLIP